MNLCAQLEAEKTRNSKSADSSQPAKRRRILQKQEAPLPFVMKDDIVDYGVNPERLGDRVLLSQNLTGHTKQAINAWVKTLKKTLGENKHQELVKVIARAPEILKRLPKEHLELLRDKIVAFGMHRSIGHKDRRPRTGDSFARCYCHQRHLTRFRIGHIVRGQFSLASSSSYDSVTLLL